MKSTFTRRASVLAVPVVTMLTTASAVMAQNAPPPPPAGEPAPPPPPAAAPAAPAAKWYDKAKVEGFVDTYFNLNFNFPKPETGNNLGRAFDVSNGFAMHWAGVNVSYPADPVGGTVGLRFGPGATIYNGLLAPGSDSAVGLQYVKQAFVSWKPGGGQVQLDLGKFDTWIGAEVADSQYNMNYTRSILFSTQPLFHTGLRIDYAASEQLDLKLFIVNGWNNSLDNNSGKTFGASVGITPTKTMAFYLNYIGGPEQNDVGGTPPAVVPDANSRWRHLVDVVADLHFDKAHVLVNGDYATEKLSDTVTTKWFGANLTLGYAVNDMFAIALRGGILSDPDATQARALFGLPAAFAGRSTSVIDGTLTLAATPTPNLIIKLEPRIDSTSVDVPGYNGVYPKAPDATPPAISKTMFTTTLGVVVTTN